METENLDAYIPVLDDRSEEDLFTQARALVTALSQGQLNDYSDGSPLNTLLRGQAFAGAELLYRANKLPLALIIKFLALTGVERNLGSKAVVSLTFTLTAARSSPFTIPQGFEVVSTAGNFKFLTKQNLIIPVGNVVGTVDAEAEDLGASYNVPAYSVTRITQPLAFLGGVVNTQPAQGGANAEPVENAINRGLAQIRARNLVSEIDFEDAAERLMGPGSRAKVIGLLGADKVTKTPGAIHVFCLAAGGEPANTAQLNTVREGLNSSILLGTTLHVSPMEILEVIVDVYAKTSINFTADTVADRLWESLQTYLLPSNQTPGASIFIEEVRHALRFTEGVQLIDYILLNNTPNNVDMPEQYTIPVAAAMRLFLSDPLGNVFQLVRGPLQDDL